MDSSLTRRESEVLQMIGEGLSNKEIAKELSISVATVKNHVHKVLDKLNLPCRAQAMRRMHEAPWLAPTAWSGKHATQSRMQEGRAHSEQQKVTR